MARRRRRNPNFDWLAFLLGGAAGAAGAAWAISTNWGGLGGTGQAPAQVTSNPATQIPPPGA